MAKKPAATPAPAKPAAPQPDTAFVELMLVAADYVKSCGGMEQATKAITDAGHFIGRAGSVASATKALEVLAHVKARISE
jgi:hypothetical protein